MKSIKRVNEAQEKTSQLLRGAQTLVTNSLAPLCGVPLEILQSVINLIVESPTQTRRIEWFRDINHHWRSAIDGMPHLFSQADWNTWPIDKIRRWSSLARTHPLVVTIEEEDQSLPRLQKHYPYEICPRPRDRRLLDSARTTVTERCQLASDLASRLGVFHLQIYTLSAEVISQCISPLLASSLPNLSKLFLFSSESQRIQLTDHTMPNLMALHFSGIEPLLLQPLEGVIDAGFGIEVENLDKSFAIVDRLPSLTRLTIHHPRDNLPLQPSATPKFPSLISLRLSGIDFGFGRPGQSAFGEILQRIDVPNLSSIEFSVNSGISVLGNMVSVQNQIPPYFDCSGNFITFSQPAKMASRIKTVVLHDVHRLWDITRPFRSPQGDEHLIEPQLLLPNLEEIIANPSKNSHAPDIEVDDDILKSFVEMRRGQFKRLKLCFSISDQFHQMLIQAGDLDEVSCSCFTPSQLSL
ncbi:hypothetical protein DL93DRAFT_1748940 [Clavulina sp. PMI_390]|nr:hypothetical protein DL93DRAFT_1748940 [Clavulina sp. PMI_390]